jgi:hypothetical protein
MRIAEKRVEWRGQIPIVATEKRRAGRLAPGLHSRRIKDY